MRAGLKRSIAIYLPDLSGGGLERLQLDLAPLFVAAGYEVSFVLGRSEGALAAQVPEGCTVTSLDASRQLTAIRPLARYLSHARPDILMVHTEHTAIISLWARAMAHPTTRVVVCQHNTASEQSRRKGWQFKIVLVILRLFLSWADRIVSVSAGVADDLASSCSIPRERIDVIYNGVVGSDFARKYAAPVDHPWFRGDLPVVVAAGRLVEQKDFLTLISAFKIVTEKREARLLILGVGPLQHQLEAHALALGISDRVALAGFRENPLPYLREASVVVLSSRYEGFAMVLAEALACGTPVVSTDCPHGPAEILDQGKYGRLTPVGDAPALADAIVSTLDAPLPSETLRKRGNLFSVSASAAAYVEIFDTILRVPNGAVNVR